MRIVLLVGFLLTTFCVQLRATDGMWLPLLLEQLNEAEMQSLGMKMSAEDIYSVNEGSLKDAIVHFGGFCTGEIISNQGLLLTNHHCGASRIQRHSTLERNLLEDGFWAASQADELPNPGLYATFIIRIEDVSEQVLAGIDEDTPDKQRQALVTRNLQLVKELAVIEDYQDVAIRPFFHGNQYFLFVTETYRDVRLVGAPSSSIGSFGRDTDNWEFPRYAGDFSLFRIYAGPDNKPATYSPDNVPYEPRHSLPISLDGVEEEDFTLVFGFPGRTEQYLPAVGLDQRVNVINPIRIGIRDKSLGILDEAMRNDPLTRIQYASKQSRIANSWKRWRGETQGIAEVGGIVRKKAYETQFTVALTENEEWEDRYGDILPSFERLYQQLEPYAQTRAYVREITNVNVELFRLTNYLQRYLKIYESSGWPGMEGRIEQLTTYLEDFYRDYQPALDQQVAATLLGVYYNEMNGAHLSPYAIDQATYAGKDYAELANALYHKSFLTKSDVALAIIRDNPEGFFQQLQGDYVLQFLRGIQDHMEREILSEYNRISQQIDVLQRRYTAALLTVFPDQRFFPDANSTLRVSYGQVNGYQDDDSNAQDHITYLDGLVERYVPGDYEFDAPERLIELYEDQDFGQYAADNGRLPVCFIGTNHTSGGNSGSPVIDGSGNLVGLNFDRSWRGTMSDVLYDPNICRNIMVDIRYVLFIVDKLAGADHLIEEMTLVHPKQ